MAWTTEEVNRVVAEIIQRSQRDPSFRSLCFNDPAAAVAGITSEPLPAGFKLRFIDNDGADLTVVLPDVIPPGDGQELSDDELSAVSGGVMPLQQQAPLAQPQSKFIMPIMGPCFAAGTPVLMADGSWQPIERILPGDAVAAFHERTGKVGSARVSQRFAHEPEAVFRAAIHGVDQALLVTPNHPFYSGGRWRKIGELPLGAELAGFDPERDRKTRLRLTVLEPAGYTEPVYNIEVDAAHTYFVHGVLVHNGSLGSK